MALAYIRDTLIGAEVPIYGTAPDASQSIVWSDNPDIGPGDYEKVADGLRVITSSPSKPILGVVDSPEANEFTVNVTAVRRGGGISFNLDSFILIETPGLNWRARVLFEFTTSSVLVYAGQHGDGSGDLLFHTGTAIPEGATDFEFIFDAVGNTGTLKRNGSTLKSDTLPHGGFFPGVVGNTTPPVGPIPAGTLTTRITGYNSGGTETGGTLRDYSLETEGEFVPPPNADFWTAFRGTREVG